MSQQARSILDIPVQASGAIAYGRAVNLIAPTSPTVLTAAQVTTSGGKMLGIARRAAASGEFVDVTCLGTAVCEAGAAITVGTRVMCDTSGRVVTATALSAAQGAIGIGTLAVAAGATAVTSTAANGAILTGAPTVAAPTLSGGDTPLFVFGTALQAASAAGDFIEVLIGN